MPSLCILSWSVKHLIPRRAATPFGPATTQRFFQNLIALRLFQHRLKAPAADLICGSDCGSSLGGKYVISLRTAVMLQIHFCPQRSRGKVMRW
jgi:hypothetical protein